jgi:hypothetical protein
MKLHGRYPQASPGHIPVAYELTSGALWDLLDIKFIRVAMAHLGYPPYICYIQGVPRIPFVLVIEGMNHIWQIDRFDGKKVVNAR